MPDNRLGPAAYPAPAQHFHAQQVWERQPAPACHQALDAHTPVGQLASLKTTSALGPGWGLSSGPDKAAGRAKCQKGSKHFILSLFFNKVKQ